MDQNQWMAARGSGGEQHAAQRSAAATVDGSMFGLGGGRPGQGHRFYCGLVLVGAPLLADCRGPTTNPTITS